MGTHLERLKSNLQMTDNYEKEYLKNIDKEPFWIGERIHVHQKNKSFMTGKINNLYLDKKKAQVHLDSNRFIVVDLAECQKLKTNGPRMLRTKTKKPDENTPPEITDFKPPKDPRSKKREN